MPVLVWIHGGAYVAGAGDAEIYDPHTLVEEQNIIVVSVTYRLGVLGFLGTGKPEHSNLGLLDQISALRWVQRNIAAFGGDPHNVTIAGQSAGADACAHLMIAEATDDLFHRVILASAPLGLAGGTEPMNWAMAKVAEKIDPDASVDDILAAQDEVHRAALVGGLHAGMCFGVHYGDYPLPAKSDTDAAWSEAARKYDVLMTRTEREIAFFAGFVPAFRRLHDRHLTSPMLESAISGITSAVYTRASKEFYDRHRMSGGQGTRLLIVSRGDGSFFDAAHSGDLPLLFPATSGTTASSTMVNQVRSPAPSCAPSGDASRPPVRFLEFLCPVSSTFWADPASTVAQRAVSAPWTIVATWMHTRSQPPV